MYEALLEFELTYDQLYEMTISELLKTLEKRRTGLAYRLWKSANLTGAAFGGKKFPKSPKEGCPELYPKPKTIQMPDVLLKKIGGTR